MKRSVLLGLFVTASMLASSSFAAGGSDNLCDTNITTIKNLKTQIQGTAIEGQVETSLNRAEALKAEGTEESTKTCITETTKTLQDIQKTDKGDKSS
ncbi:hypothetical protein [Pseudomonas sp. St316]|uniref:hypothetical protein n=1 Tax=Pseudomonas sp. St316 TaxID=2678257 RepID=UPI001BB3773E|nr:hypothetical protein [Pseudomonas sp. St316]BBP61582.1 hypothetical protein PHLH4_51720 [Pseudomonas sp. St316]